jgi:hypothetical protein
VAKYAHRHRLHPDDPNLLPAGSEHAAIIRASFTLAALAHAGQSRDKINPTIDYISHPIMVYDILHELGEDDPVLLAAGFLHDVLEQPAYRGDPERLLGELEIALEKEGVDPTHAQPLAAQIYGLVYEVTNPKVLPKNKELYQIDHGTQMSFAAKKLKIADQAASLVCNLLMPNDPEVLSYEKERGFKEKAETLCYSMIASVQKNPAQRAAMAPYDAFFTRLLRKANQLFPHPKSTEQQIFRERMRVRHHFDFYELFTGPIESLLAPPNPVAEKLYLYDPDALPEKLATEEPLGLIRVDYDTQGRVSAFYLHVTSDASRENEINQQQQKLTADIRDRLRWAGHYTEGTKQPVQMSVLQPGELAPIDQNIRRYELHPAMHHDAFAAAAKSACVTSMRDAQLIKKVGSQLRQDHDRLHKVPGRYL